MLSGISMVLRRNQSTKHKENIDMWSVVVVHEALGKCGDTCTQVEMLM